MRELLSLTVIKCSVKATWGSLFSSPFPDHNPSLKEFRAVVEAETMEGHCLLVWSFWFIQSRMTCTGHGTTHNGLSPPTSITNQEMSPKDQSDGDNFSLQVPSFQVTQLCVKTAIKTN